MPAPPAAAPPPQLLQGVTRAQALQALAELSAGEKARVDELLAERARLFYDRELSEIWAFRRRGIYRLSLGQAVYWKMRATGRL